MNIILASTSTLYGESYLAYLLPLIPSHFQEIDEILFIPYARAGGLSHDEYTAKATEALKQVNIRVTGIHTYHNPQEAIRKAKGIFTGGGNTFLLVKLLHELGLMQVIKECITKGTPYLGASAGSNIAGVNMRTTNDMPIVYPPSFDTMSLMPFNINPHYLDPMPELHHNGETREMRIKEFHTQNDVPVVGLREGSWVKVDGSTITTEGSKSTRVFEKDKEPYEISPGTTINFSGY